MDEPDHLEPMRKGLMMMLATIDYWRPGALRFARELDPAIEEAGPECVRMRDTLYTSAAYACLLLLLHLYGKANMREDELVMNAILDSIKENLGAQDLVLELLSQMTRSHDMERSLRENIGGFVPGRLSDHEAATPRLREEIARTEGLATTIGEGVLRRVRESMEDLPGIF